MQVAYPVDLDDRGLTRFMGRLDMSEDLGWVSLRGDDATQPYGMRHGSQNHTLRMGAQSRGVFAIETIHSRMLGDVEGCLLT